MLSEVQRWSGVQESRGQVQRCSGSTGVWGSSLGVFQKYRSPGVKSGGVLEVPEFRGYEWMAFITVGMNMPCFNSLQTIMRIAVYPRESGSCSRKSMDMEFQGCSGIRSCLRKP